MADEPVTDATNSAEASQTDASAATASPSSNTTHDAPADPLDGPGGLGDAPPAPAAGAAEGDGEAQDDAGDSGGDKGEEAPPALIGAPEGDYDLAGLLPEGTALDTEALSQIAPTAKELNLSNAGLARLATDGLPIVEKQVSGRIVSEVLAQRAAWDAETRAAITGGKNAEGEAVAADPVFAGKSYDDVTSVAAKAIDRFAGDKLFPKVNADGSPGTFRDFLKVTGLGNHPAMMYFAYQSGALISEDTSFERGGGIPNTPKSREEKYYGPTSSA